MYPEIASNIDTGFSIKHFPTLFKFAIYIEVNKLMASCLLALFNASLTVIIYTTFLHSNQHTYKHYFNLLNQIVNM